MAKSLFELNSDVVSYKVSLSIVKQQPNYITEIKSMHNWRNHLHNVYVDKHKLYSDLCNEAEQYPVMVL